MGAPGAVEEEEQEINLPVKMETAEGCSLLTPKENQKSAVAAKSCFFCADAGQAATRLAAEGLHPDGNLETILSRNL